MRDEYKSNTTPLRKPLIFFYVSLLSLNLFRMKQSTQPNYLAVLYAT